MPTGYTADVGDGKVRDFSEFAMHCARAFGALVMMRDEPNGAEIPAKFEPSSYHVKALASAKERLAELESMTDDEKHRQSRLAYDGALAYWRKAEAKRVETRDNYEAMLDKVLAWEPPTSQHTEMKSFMVEQLESSIKFDCNGYAAPEQPTVAEWYADELARATRNIEYHEREDGKERERAEGRTEWVQALRESLADKS